MKSDEQRPGNCYYCGKTVKKRGVGEDGGIIRCGKRGCPGHKPKKKKLRK